jgi:hypothetical protein
MYLILTKPTTNQAIPNQIQSSQEAAFVIKNDHRV